MTRLSGARERSCGGDWTDYANRPWRRAKRLEPHPAWCRRARRRLYHRAFTSCLRALESPSCDDFVMHRRAVARDDPTAAARATVGKGGRPVCCGRRGFWDGSRLRDGPMRPGLMGRFGDVIGLPFAIEGLSAPARSHRSLPRAGHFDYRKPTYTGGAVMRDDRSHGTQSACWRAFGWRR
jgi:hypothetical protein